MRSWQQKRQHERNEPKTTGQYAVGLPDVSVLLAICNFKQTM
jgi:hypothetical protein